MNYNKCILIGHLARDPEIRNTTSGTAVCNTALAVNHKWKDASGEKKEQASFIDLKVWGATAEKFVKFFVKGSNVMVEGRLEQETWEDKNDGSKRSKLVLVVDRFEFVPQGRKDADDGGKAKPAPVKAKRQPIPDDTDLPF